MNRDFYPLTKSISFIYRKMQAIVNKSLSNIDVGSGEYMFLLYLNSKEEGVSQENISDFLNCDKALTARVINKLEEKKMVYRMNSSNDKRKKMVYLTDKGKNISKEIKIFLNEFNDKLSQNFNEEEIDNYLTYLNKTMECLKKIENRGNYDENK